MNKKSGYFDPVLLKSDLKGRSIRAGFVTGGAQLFKFLLQLGSTIILARLLTPKDYGLIGMVGAVIAFLSLFKDMGLSMATIQREEIEPKQVSILFWINVAISIVIMLIAMMISSAIAAFYKEPRLVAVTISLALGFLFSGMTVQHEALLRRMMKFSALAIIEVLSLLVSIIVAVILALSGAQYWALVSMQLTMAVSSAIGVWIACEWRPGRPALDADIRSMLNFGGNVTGTSVLHYFARNLDHILIGRAWGTQQLGIYTKAYQLLLMPIHQVNVPLTSVAIPTLSSLQNEKERFRRYYCTALNLIAYISCPLILCMAALSEEIILIILGNQWVGAIKIFRVLAFAALFQPLVSTVGWIFVSLGQTERWVKWALVTVPACIAVFFIGLPWGAYGVAVSYTVYYILMVIPSFLYACSESPIAFKDIVKSVWRPLTISVFAYTAITFGKYMFDDFSQFKKVAVSLVISLIVIGVSILAWPKAKHEAMELIDAIKLIRSRKYSPT